MVVVTLPTHPAEGFSLRLPPSLALRFSHGKPIFTKLSKHRNDTPANSEAE